MDYCVGPDELPAYLDRVNALLTKKGTAALTPAQLRGQVNQLKAFADVCHLYGLAARQLGIHRDALKAALAW
jgi:1,4-alpha-glucan branching enzyme